jgi:ELWxxDGT repeat protein
MNRILFAFAFILSISYANAQEHFYDFIERGLSSSTKPVYGNDDFALFLHGKDLYVTDGSKSGTSILYNFESTVLQYGSFLEFANRTYFSTQNTTGSEIWSTNGTTNGTKLLFKADGNYHINVMDLQVIHNKIYFAYRGSTDSFYIARADSAFNKTEVIAKIKIGASPTSNLVATDNYAFIATHEKIHRIDTNGTVSKYFEKTGSVPAGINDLYEHNNAIIWHMRESSKTQVYAGKEALNSDVKVELLYGYIWFRDVEGIGKHFYYSEAPYNGNPQLHRLNTETLSQEEVRSTSDPYVAQQVFEIAAFKGELYFQGYTSGGDVELWKTGASNSATTLVKNIASDTSGRPMGMVATNNKLFFSAYTRDNGRELWSSDGTTAGTKMVANLVEGGTSSNMGLQMVRIGSKVISPAYTYRYGTEPWVSDGTEAGTELLLDINPKVDRGNQQVSSFMPVGDYLYLFANDSINGAELWRTDGSEDGTILLDNINIANFPSGMEEYIEFKGNLYGTAVSFLEGIELYTSNGTPQGSKFVTPSDLFSSTYPHDYVVDGNYFYYIGSTGLFGGQAIFRSDGTKAGTKPYLATGNDINGVSNLTRVGDRFYASIDDDTYGNEPYEVDLENGTLTLIHNFAANNKSSNPKFFCGTNDTLYFVFEQYDNNYYICMTTTDFGYRTETALAGIPLRLKNSYPDTFFRTPNTFYMLAETDKNVHRLLNMRMNTGWRGFNPKTEYDNVKDLMSIGDRVIFSAQHSTYGQELYITNGTDSGTILLKDINPGSASSNPDNFYVFNDRLIFTATTAANGTEVWITDGTTAGTKLLWDIQKGSGSSYPTEYAAYKGYLYISASDSIREKSLYRFIIDSCDIIAPEIASNKNSFVVCEGETIDLYAKTGLEVEKLTWYKNGNPIITAGDTFTTNEVGKYKFEVANGSCALSSAEIELKSAPTVNFTVGFESDSGFCEGGSLSLLASGDNDLSVKWYRDGEEYSSQLKTTTFADGEFFAIGRNQFGCRDTSRTLTVEVYENPKPDVTLISDTLWSTVTGVDYTYQWFFKGVEIPGETNEYVAPKENGAYKVEVTNDKGCAGQSSGFKYEGSNIDDFISAFNIGAYPNPFAQNTLISYELPIESYVQIEVYNELGQKIETIVETAQSAGSYQIEFNANTQGIYLVKLQIGEAQAVIRLVKNK